MPTYPSDLEPGIGLPGYYLSVNMGDRTLIITRRRRGTPVAPPKQVRLVRLPYPEIAISERTGFARTAAIVLKAFGYLTFFVLSLPFMLLFRPHVVHVHTPMPILHGLFARYVLRRPFFITFHGTDMHSVARWALLRTLVRRANVVCYVSKPMRATLEKVVAGESLLYTPNGVDVEAFAPGDCNRSPSVLMVGSLRWHKGYPVALSAFARFRQSNPDWRLQVVGVGPQRQELEEQTRALSLDGSVSFLGVRSRNEVATLMRQSRLFMLSSVTEGFPKVLLEAAASGTPSVVTDVGSCRELAEQGVGLVVAPSDPEALAGALDTLAREGPLWDELSQRGPSVARDFSWTTTARAVRAAYASQAGSLDPALS